MKLNMASKVRYKHYWNDVLVITIRACLHKDFSSYSFLIRTQIHWLRWFHAGCWTIPMWHFNWAFSNIYFQLTQGAWVHTNEVQETKRSKLISAWWNLWNLFSNRTRFGQDANGGKCKISTILCLYRFKYWDYTQSMERRKLDCLETLTRGSYCSATQ